MQLDPCSVGSASHPVRHCAQRLSDYMLVVVTIALLILIFGYSTLKTIEYNELVQKNVRYRNAVIGFNTVTVLVAVLVVIYTVHTEAVSRIRVQEK